MSMLKKLRRALVSKKLYQMMRHSLPAISQTERDALTAGNTWWDAELFSGNPDWSKLNNLPMAKLSDKEQNFIDGEVETLCNMLDDWDITFKRKDLPPEVWTYIKQQRFCGIIIPEHYGGLAFSEFAHSQIVMKIASRSTSAAVTVMVPNSLGPAKLLLAYGSDQQKQYYLPRLAKGLEIPAFALTGPHAGSDASAIPDTGVVCHDRYQGEDNILGMRLNWEKRYITLGPVATVLGMAFRLYDPEHLLGDQEELGITLALIPTNTPGVNIGKRHFPLDSAFQNGPNWGNDVFVPIDNIIGGREQAGQGWKMLMQCLATGRSISLPALSVGAAKFVCRTTGAYARIREQFNLPLGYMQGIEELLARMAGETYLLDAARQVTCAALDAGEKPAIISAMLKYQTTEGMRRIVNDAMDIQGGSGICLGPANYIGRLYQVIPIGITVEGANILTRTLMIFGQGSVRCHPLVLKELEALQCDDEQAGLRAFDELICEHAIFFAKNIARGMLYSVGGSINNKFPHHPATNSYFKKLQRLSNAFAVIADYSLIMLGGKLKRKERISGQLADVFSHLYLCSCVLKHYQNQGYQKDDKVLMDWACHISLYRAQQALLTTVELLANVPVKILITLLFPFGRPLRNISDSQIKPLASVLLTDNATRQRLTAGIFINRQHDQGSGRIEHAFTAVLNAESARRKVRQALKQKILLTAPVSELLSMAVKQNIISQQESDLIEYAQRARNHAIRVDDFDSLLN